MIIVSGYNRNDCYKLICLLQTYCHLITDAKLSVN